MKLDKNTKDRIDNYFKNIDAEDLYYKVLEEYHFEKDLESEPQSHQYNIKDNKKKEGKEDNR